MFNESINHKNGSIKLYRYHTCYFCIPINSYADTLLEVSNGCSFVTQDLPFDEAERILDKHLQRNHPLGLGRDVMTQTKLCDYSSRKRGLDSSEEFKQVKCMKVVKTDLSPDFVSCLVDFENFLKDI